MGFCRVLSIVAAALLLAVPLAAHAQSVVRLTNGEWPPYHSEEAPHYGVASHIVAEAFRLQGIGVLYGFFPWRRALDLARIGEWDGAATWLKSADRERDFYFSEPVLDSQYVFFHLKDAPFAWSSIGDLAKYRLGITNEYFYGHEFMDALKNGQLQAEGVPSDEQNFRKLLAGRIDAFPIDKRVAIALLKKHFSAPEIHRLAYDARPLYSEPLHLLLSKKNPANRKLIEEFNKGLKKLKANGQYEAYLREVSTLNVAAGAPPPVK
ncbi:MAG TPA: transporter substrate-binding domain-containing protein [Paucimonas sp.]|nr:transporter substrate-binding domain-containing protein [Paucimonas sp.]